MDIVYVSGSPRSGGNSDFLAQYFLRQCCDKGAEVTSYYLNKLTYRGCQACDQCKTVAEKCTLKDDLSPLLDHIFVADLVVFASPVYYGDVSAQLKGLIDRTYSYLKPGYMAKEHPNRLEVPKKLVFIITQGHRDEAVFADIIPRYSDIFRWTGFSETYPLRVVDVYHRGDIDQRTDVLREAEQLTEKLMNDFTDR